VFRSLFVFVAGSLVGAVAAAAFLLTRPSGPRVDGVAPLRGRPGEAVTIKGGGFAPSTRGNLVLFGDQPARVLNATGEEIRVEVPEPAAATGGEIRLGLRVVTGDRASATTDFTAYRETGAEIPTQETSLATPLPAAGPATPVAAPTVAAAPATPAPTSAPTTAAPVVAAVSAPAKPAAAAPRRAAPPPTAAAAPPTAPPLAPPRVEPPAPEPPLAPRREFVLERTAAESHKKANSGLAGFDAAEVDLKRAPSVPGRIDFEVAPARVKPGDHYSVTAYLINDGGKPIRIKEMFVATNVNGVLSAGRIPPRLQEVAPKKREVIGVFSNIWRDNVATWAFDITLTSDREDVYKNQVIWK
jgi:IPT/TIG domain-containing protein